MMRYELCIKGLLMTNANNVIKQAVAVMISHVRASGELAPKSGT